MFKIFTEVKIVKTKFGKKLLALFLAVLMALTAFTGAFSAYAASADPSYHDDALKANALAWVELTDEQTCAALLDYVDDILYDLKMPVASSPSIPLTKTISRWRIWKVFLTTASPCQSLPNTCCGIIGANTKA